MSFLMSVARSWGPGSDLRSIDTLTRSIHDATALGCV